jgi:hypothetical protein
MSYSRREFIIGSAGAAAGLILPSWYDKASSFFENHGEPLLEVPPDPEIELFAVDRGGCGELELNWGDPWCEPPEMTTREFAIRYFGGEEYYRTAYDEEDIDWDAKADYWLVLTTWIRRDSPSARAYRLLEGFDLGPAFSGKDPVGEIEFIDGPCPGNDYLGVQAADQMSVALLQKRLTDLDARIKVSMSS